jgi:hypothetical protein
VDHTRGQDERVQSTKGIDCVVHGVADLIYAPDIRPERDGAGQCDGRFLEALLVDVD